MIKGMDFQYWLVLWSVQLQTEERANFFSDPWFTVTYLRWISSSWLHYHVRWLLLIRASTRWRSHRHWRCLVPEVLVVCNQMSCAHTGPWKISPPPLQQKILVAVNGMITKEKLFCPRSADRSFRRGILDRHFSKCLAYTTGSKSALEVTTS